MHQQMKPRRSSCLPDKHINHAPPGNRVRIFHGRKNKMTKKKYPKEIYLTPTGAAVTAPKKRRMVEKAYNLGYTTRSHTYLHAEPDPLAGFSNLTQAIQDGTRIDWERLDERYAPPVHGFEIKVSRSDWLSEHRTQGKKSAPWRSYCNYWWIVVPRRDIVKPEELPAGWGLLVGTKRLSTHVHPVRNSEAEKLPTDLMLTIARYSQRSTK